MKLRYLLLPVLMFSINSLAQKPTYKKENGIASIEREANAARFNNELLSMSSDNFTVHYCKCEWEIDPDSNYIIGKITVHFIIKISTSSLVFDLSYALTVDSIYIHNEKPGFLQATNETLTVQLPKTYEGGEKDSLTIYYHGVPVGGSFGSFVQSTHNGTPVIWTLSEPFGAKDWWPCRNGLDDKIDSIDIYIQHPKGYSASSNGILQTVEATGNNIITHYKHRYPIASYLVALAVTNYSVFTEYVQSGNISMPVISYVYPEDSATFHNNTFKMLNAMQLYNAAFATYPFINERYGQTEFGWGGGMEHQTNSFITSPDENLMAHELAHQWFGNKITCASWEDIWLNEGFATFCADFLYWEKYNSTQYKITVKSDLDNIVSQPGGSVKVDDTTNVGRIFNGRLSYDKGAFLLRMLRWTLGDSLFFKGISNYINDPGIAYNFARTTDLKRNLEAVSGIDLTYFFDQWFTGQGYPSFTVLWSQNINNKANITISQTTSHSSVSFFKVPLTLTFKNTTQQKTIVVQHTFNNQTLIADIGFKADTLLIDPDNNLISKNNISIKLVTPEREVIPFTVFPNPFKDRITVVLHEASGKNVLLRLYDNIGHLVTKSSIISNSSIQTYTLAVPLRLSAGSYFLRITVDGKVVTRKVIKH